MPSKLFFPMLLSGALLAQVTHAQEAQVANGLRAWRLAGCASCHGTFGEGGGGGEQPEGPSLRRTALDKSTMKETIACGRPGTKMPFFLKGAYTATECWKIPLQEEAPGDVTGLPSLSPQTLDALVDYLTARVVGKSDTISKAECAAYFANASHPTCASLE
jgi:mono/diheme cytochrome c family protein